VEELSAKTVIGNMRKTVEDEVAPVGLKVQLTGAPVMQLEIRNAVERDQLVYNGLGLLFGALIAVVFFRRVSLMLTAALPPVLAVLWSLGLLGLLELQAQPVPQCHDAARHGDGLCRQHADGVGDPHPPARRRHAAAGRAVRRARGGTGLRAGARHGAAVVRGSADLAVGTDPHLRVGGILSTGVSFVAVILVLPLLGYVFIRNEASWRRPARRPTG
jgi:hypothetical protein